MSGDFTPQILSNQQQSSAGEISPFKLLQTVDEMYFGAFKTTEGPVQSSDYLAGLGNAMPPEFQKGGGGMSV